MIAPLSDSIPDDLKDFIDPQALLEDVLEETLDNAIDEATKDAIEELTSKLTHIIAKKSIEPIKSE